LVRLSIMYSETAMLIVLKLLLSSHLPLQKREFLSLKESDEVRLGIDHAAYPHSTRLSFDLVTSLQKDF
jgi:hypothetical protein